jgi:hypothetical protein
MFFVVFCTDKAGFEDVRSRARPEHRQHLRNPGNHPVQVRIAGPTHRADGAMNGTMLVVEAEMENHVHAFLADDPYIRADLFETVCVRRWTWGLGSPEQSS